MERVLIPVIARRSKKLLFVGCRRYTRRYPAMLEALGAECWTIDIDPSVARWGAPGRHVTDGIERALDHWPTALFDTIVLNGLFGFGLDKLEDQENALRVCRTLLRRDGWLILGWDTDRCSDPIEMSIVQRNFRLASLAGLAKRRTFDASPHVLDTLAAT
jgi:hypothetical protein